MPRVFRSMRGSEQGPDVGHEEGSTLGVRIGYDTSCTEDGRVSPNTGGMSVSSSIATINPMVIPKRFKSRYPGARGGNNTGRVPWRFGDGEFCNGPLCDRLALTLDTGDDGHGFVEPDTEMTVEEYKAAIEATREGWVREDW